MRITDAESKILEALWAKSPRSAEEIISEITVSQAWGRATVKTLINRLLKKHAIRSERVEGRHQYVPLVDRASYVQAESQGLLDRLFGGELAPLVAHFAERRALKPEEIARLKALLAELDPDGD